jgi:hypothetical protein
LNPLSEIVVLGKPQMHGRASRSPLTSSPPRGRLCWSIWLSRGKLARGSPSQACCGVTFRRNARGGIYASRSANCAASSAITWSHPPITGVRFLAPHSLDAAEFTRHCAAPEKADPANSKPHRTLSRQFSRRFSPARSARFRNLGRRGARAFSADGAGVALHISPRVRRGKTISIKPPPSRAASLRSSRGAKRRTVS